MASLQTVLSRKAKQDLVDIWTYVAADNELRAGSFVDELHERCVALAANPELGRAVPVPEYQPLAG